MTVGDASRQRRRGFERLERRNMLAGDVGLVFDHDDVATETGFAEYHANERLHVSDDRIELDHDVGDSYVAGEYDDYEQSSVSKTAPLVVFVVPVVVPTSLLVGSDAPKSPAVTSLIGTTFSGEGEEVAEQETEQDTNTADETVASSTTVLAVEKNVVVSTTNKVVVPQVIGAPGADAANATLVPDQSQGIVQPSDASPIGVAQQSDPRDNGSTTLPLPESMNDGYAEAEDPCLHSRSAIENETRGRESGSIVPEFATEIVDKVMSSNSLAIAGLSTDFAAIDTAMSQLLDDLDGLREDASAAVSDMSLSSWAIGATIGLLAIELVRRHRQYGYFVNNQGTFDDEAAVWMFPEFCGHPRSRSSGTMT